MLAAPVVWAQDCLEDDELVSMVVIEHSIARAVEAYACVVYAQGNEPIYRLQEALADKWRDQQNKHRDARDKVYKRIYGDAWQAKTEAWEQGIALQASADFKASAESCWSLDEELQYVYADWQVAVDAAARQAAGPQYAPLRCQGAS